MIIRNSNFNRLAGFWSFHTILVFKESTKNIEKYNFLSPHHNVFGTGLRSVLEGQLDRLSNILQKDAKFARLTIGNLRDNRNSETTFTPRLYEDKWFFFDIKVEFIRAGSSVFYE